jgi:dCTP diphosphatase
MNQSEFAELTARIRAFADARNWEKFHTPKNLSMAVAGEAGELVAEFQWLTSEESTLASLSPEQLQAIKLEIADVQIYLLRLADVLKIDIPAAVIEKMEINESRF